MKKYLFLARRIWQNLFHAQFFSKERKIRFLMVRLRLFALKKAVHEDVEAKEMFYLV